MVDLIGILAGIFVVLAFYATDPERLRQHAIVSNILFITYAIQLGLWPIVLLHAVLLPLNWKRLSELQIVIGLRDQSPHMSDGEREVFLQSLRHNPHCWASYIRQ